MNLHGDRGRFAMGFELREDSDKRGSVSRRASWGALSIWVAGRNLTRGRIPTGGIVEDAEVPLLPIVRWLIEQWDFLLHEERLPTPARSQSAAAWRLDSLRALPSDDDALSRLLTSRERWWSRHGLATALPDFRVPDLHFRRRGHEIELSWDDREWRSVGTGIELVEQPGVALMAVSETAEVLRAWCEATLSALAGNQAIENEVTSLLEASQALTDPQRQEKRLRIAAGLDLERAARHLRRLAGLKGDEVGDTVRALLGLESQCAGLRYAALPAPVLLYRSASPVLSDADLRQLLELGQCDNTEEGRLAELRAPVRCLGSPADITQDGLERALAFREQLDLPPEASLTSDHDLEGVLLPDLGIRVADLHLDDVGVEGAAVFGSGRRPTIAVNLSGRFSQTRWGRRMTLAHELCHLLHDGDLDGTVGVVSNPWAPYSLERRANAFAVTLLAPEPAIERCLIRDTRRWTVHNLKDAMADLGIGITSLTWQLYNLGWISSLERDGWLEAFVSA